MPGLFLAVFLFPLFPLSAQTIWTGAGDGISWSDAGNWSAGVPAPGVQTRFLNGSLPDAPIVVNVDGAQNLGTMNFATSGDRSVTIGGSILNLVASAGATNILWDRTSPGDAPIVINSGINYSNSAADTGATFSIGNLTQTITFNGNITTSGTGTRTFNVTSAGVIVMNADVSSTHMTFGGTGEYIAASLSALGGGAVQKTNTAILSLRSDVVITGGTSGYSWLQTSSQSGIRISEIAPSAVDRTLTLEKRISGTNTLEFLDNINSTGNLIMEFAYSGGNAQGVNLITNTSTIIRFTQTGTTTYSGLISGAGRLELRGGGITQISIADTYTGSTTVSNGSTLSLTLAGAIGGTSELNLASGTTFNISGITAAGYTFDADQTVSGTGTIVSGGKNLTIEGTLAPGDSPGTLTMDLGAGTLFLGGDVDLQFELGTLSDLVLLSSGVLDIGTGLLEFSDFSFTASDGFGVGEYVLFQTGNNIVGSFGGDVTGFVGGFASELKFSGNNLILEVVPEPSSILMMLLGGLLLGAGAWRTRSKTQG